jgi:predicted esterase
MGPRLMGVVCCVAVVVLGVRASGAEPANWPWDVWQRDRSDVQRWPQLDSGGLLAYRQSVVAFDGSTMGTVFFVVPPTQPGTTSDQTRVASSIELPRLDNVVERVWWWPSGENAVADLLPQANTAGDEYRMPLVPPANRLMKLTQTPTRWTLAFNDPEAAGRALAGGGFVVMDVRDQPRCNVDAETIIASQDGTIVLPAAKAKVFGKQLQFEPLPHKNTVGYWVNADDFATWMVSIPESGEYQVHVLQGCGTGHGGSQVAIGIGDAVVEMTVVETGHFQNFRWRDLGPVHLAAGDDVLVKVRCLAKAKAAVMDVRQIRLVPVASRPPRDDRKIEPDVHLPPLTHEPPGPGRRSIRQATVVDGSDAYHLLSLPTDWSASRRYPVLVEWTGNGPVENQRGDRSSGRVENARLAYGLGGGDGWIVLTLPFVNDAGTANVSKWWGDTPDYRPDASIAYAKAAIDEVCDRFGGDRSRLILVGFSRGAIACNAVGLANDDVSQRWRGFVCCSHYDGVRPWPPTGDAAVSLERLARLGGRPQLIVSEIADDAKPSHAQQARRYLKNASIDMAKLRFLETGFENHSDAWVMRPNAARDEARQWLAELIND